MGILEDAIRTLDQIGVTDVLLPFILIFTIVYAVGGAIPFFGAEGKTKNKFRLVIAGVVAALVIIPHVTNPGRYDVVRIILESIPQVALLIVAAIMVLFVIASTNTKVDEEKGILSASWVKYGSLIIVILIFLDNIFQNGLISRLQYMSWFGYRDFQAILLIILIFAGLILFIAGDDLKGKGDAAKMREEAEKLKKAAEALESK